LFLYSKIFSSFGADLPAFTNGCKYVQLDAKILVYSNYCNWGNYYSFSRSKKRSKKFRDGLDQIALKASNFGDLVYKAIIARYSRTLATTFAAGVPLIDALESTAGATNNVIYEEAVMKIREDVATGQQLQFAMRVSIAFHLWRFKWLQSVKNLVL
jgi:type IV pilus assembly protein PilC